MKKKGKHKANAPAVEQAVDEFFAPLTENQDWYGDAERAVAAKYRTLVDTVKKVLADPMVVKVGGGR